FEHFDAVVAQVRLRQVELLQLVQALDVLQRVVADLGIAQAELLHLGEKLDHRDLRVGDFGAGKIDGEDRLVLLLEVQLDLAAHLLDLDDRLVVGLPVLDLVRSLILVLVLGEGETFAGWQEPENAKDEQSPNGRLLVYQVGWTEKDAYCLCCIITGAISSREEIRNATEGVS